MPDPAGINTRRAARRSLDGTRTAYSNAASQPCHPSPHCFATIRSDEQACVSLRLLKEMNGLPESVTGLPCTQVLDSTHGLKWGLRGGGVQIPLAPLVLQIHFRQGKDHRKHQIILRITLFVREDDFIPHPRSETPFQSVHGPS